MKKFKENKYFLGMRAMLLAIMLLFSCSCSTNVWQYHSISSYVENFNLDLTVEKRIIPASNKVISMINAMDSTDKYKDYSLNSNEASLSFNFSNASLKSGYLLDSSG